jgi:signal transduction histidine kinase
LPALECSSGFQPSCWRSSDGQLYFSTANGVVSVNPSEVTQNRVPPKIIIEEILVDGKTRHVPTRPSSAGAITHTDSVLKIEPGRHYVQFRFTGLSFTSPDGVRFRVKLDGVDRDWQSTGEERWIGYGPLLPGNYRFNVRASNNDGFWSENGDALAFTVQPFFWETLWFKIGLSLATLAALGLVVGLDQRRRFRLKLERIERQREMEHERTRIARDLHDDLGTSLTQISMLSALANREKTPPAEAKEIIQQVRGRAKEMVIALDEIVWAVNPQNDSLNGLASYLGHFAEEFFQPTGIRCRLDIPAELPEKTLSAELRHHLFLAFKEALNNAARHSKATEVCVRIEYQANNLDISVKDNGRGFSANGSEATSGNGLPNMKRRLEQSGGTAEIISAVGKGTEIEFHVPL